MSGVLLGKMWRLSQTLFPVYTAVRFGVTRPGGRSVRRFIPVGDRDPWLAVAHGVWRAIDRADNRLLHMKRSLGRRSGLNVRERRELRSIVDFCQTRLRELRGIVQGLRRDHAHGVTATVGDLQKARPFKEGVVPIVRPLLLMSLSPTRETAREVFAAWLATVQHYPSDVGLILIAAGVGLFAS